MCIHIKHRRAILFTASMTTPPTLYILFADRDNDAMKDKLPNENQDMDFIQLMDYWTNVHLMDLMQFNVLKGH